MKIKHEERYDKINVGTVSTSRTEYPFFDEGYSRNTVLSNLINARTGVVEGTLYRATNGFRTSFDVEFRGISSKMKVNILITPEQHNMKINRFLETFGLTQVLEDDEVVFYAPRIGD